MNDLTQAGKQARASVAPIGLPSVSPLQLRSRLRKTADQGQYRIVLRVGHGLDY